MSESTYKRWMKESYLYEEDDDKVIGTREKEDGEKVKVTVKQAMDYSGDDKDMLALKDKAKELKSKDNGGEEKPKAEPKKTAISKTGGLGGDDGDGVEINVDMDDDEPEGGEEKPPEDMNDEELDDAMQQATDDYDNLRDTPKGRAAYDKLIGLEDEKKKRRKGAEESIKVINGKKYRAIQESVNKRVAVKEVYRWLKSLEEYRYRKVPGVDARRITSFVNNGLNETDLPISLQKKWESAKYNKEKSLADRFIKQRISQKLTQTESKHPIKEQYDRLFTDRAVL